MKKSLTNYDLQEFIKKGFTNESSSFDITLAKNSYIETKDIYIQQKEATEKKIKVLEKFPNNDKFKGKIDELYTVLAQLDDKLEKNEKILHIDAKTVIEYLNKKQQQIHKFSNSITKQLIENNNQKYEELFTTFKDDSDFLETINGEKKKALSDLLVSNEKLSNYNVWNNYVTSIQENLNNTDKDTTPEDKGNEEVSAIDVNELSTFLENVYQLYQADLSWIAGKDLATKITDVYNFVKKNNPEKISLKELQPNQKGKKKTLLKYNKIAGRLPYLLHYYGGYTLLSSSKVNSLLDAASVYISSMDKLKEFNYSIENICNDLEFGNSFDVSELQQELNVTSLIDSTNIQDKLKLAQEKASLNVKNLRGLKAFVDSYQKFPEQIQGVTKQSFREIFSALMELGETVIKEIPLTTDNKKYQYYNAIVSEYDEVISQSYDEFVLKVNQIIKNPSFIDKMMVLFIIAKFFYRLNDGGKMREVLDVVFAYRYEGILADMGEKEYETFFCISSFFSAFNDFFSNIITFKEKYPKLYQDTYGNSFYGNPDSFCDKQLTYYNLSRSLKYGDSVLKTKLNIQKFVSHIDDKITDEINEQDISRYKKIITQNLHRFPYNDTIIVDSSSNKTNNTDEEYTLEVHKVDNPNYIGVLRFNSFDKAIVWEKFNQFIADIKGKEGDKMNISTAKQTTTLGNQRLDEDIIAIHRVDSDFGGLAMLHKNGDISINGINEDGLRYVVGEEEYDKFQKIVLKNLAECCKVVDCRSEDTFPYIQGNGVYEKEDIRITNPTKIYNPDSFTHTGKRNIFYKKEHIRLLHKNMITGYTGWEKSRETGTPLYACIYHTSSDPLVDNPIKTIALDTFGDIFSEVRCEMKKLREQYNTDTTFIRFQTYVDEFLKEGQTHQGQTVIVLNPHQ